MDLPLRPKQLDVPVLNGEIVFHFRPPDDAQLIELYRMEELLDQVHEEGSDSEADAARVEGLVRKVRTQDIVRDERFSELVEATYIGATCRDGDPLTVGGVPFDPSRAEHVQSLPFLWRLEILGSLLDGTSPVTKDLLGNSEGRESPSPKDGARSKGSRPESVVSS